MPGELVQETQLKAYKAFDKLREDTHFRAWLLCRTGRDTCSRPNIKRAVYYMDVLGMKCREAAELMACRKAPSYRERAVSGPTCAGHWAWMRATVTAGAMLEICGSAWEGAYLPG